MGALTEGYDSARQKHDGEVAESHRRDDVVDHELHELAELLNLDAKVLKDNGVAYQVVHRAIHLTHQRSPVVTVHYSVEGQEYTITFMRDGSHATLKTAEECAKAISEMLFNVLELK